MNNPKYVYFAQDAGGPNAALTLVSLNDSNNAPIIPSLDNSSEIIPEYELMSSQEQNAIVNVTRQYPFAEANILFGIIMPFILAETLLTNGLVVWVLSQKHMRSPTNIVLLRMAIVDLLTLCFPAPWYFYIYTLGYHDRFLHPPLACYAHYIMTDATPVFFHTSSIWLALLLASQRYIYVCHPTLASTWCTVPRVNKAIKYILVTALLHQITRFIDNRFVSIRILYKKKPHLACKIELLDWISGHEGVYFSTYYAFRIIFVFIIPCILLVALNCLLFRALKRAEHKRTQLLHRKHKSKGGGRVTTARQDLGSFNNEMSGRCSINGVTCGSLQQPIAAIKNTSAPNEASTGACDIEAQGNELAQRHGGTLDKRRKFSLTSFQARCKKSAVNKDQCAIGDENETKSVASLVKKHSGDTESEAKAIALPSGGERANFNDKQYTARTAESKNNCGKSAFEEDKKETIKAISKFSQQERGVPQEKQISEESNLNCPSAGALFSRRLNEQPFRLEQAKNSAQIKKDRSKRFATSQQQQNSGSNGASLEDEEADLAKDEGAFLCAHCVEEFEEHNQELSACQRCSAVANVEASTGEQGNMHKAVSQCSSLLGGVTNTTTNEDVSSCLVTQNASSSMFVANDNGTLEGATEPVSVRGDEDLDLEENLSLNQNCDEENRAGSRLENKRNSESSKRLVVGYRGLHKSGSVDSRLACGCFTGDSSRAIGQKNKRPSMRRSGGDDTCKYCCSSSSCQRSTRGFINSSSVGKSQTCAGDSMEEPRCRSSICSNSERICCINCNKTLVRTVKAATFTAASPREVKLEKKDDDMYKEMSNVKCSSATANQFDFEAVELKDLNKGSSNNKSDGCVNTCSETNKTATTTNTTTTTATTTLHSTTNSAGSLLQVHIGNPQVPLPVRQESSQLSETLPQHQALPLQSIARKRTSSVDPGRSSTDGMQRPRVFVSRHNTTSATIRTMDSNRTTLMLIVVVTVFLLVEVPAGIVTIIFVMYNVFEKFAHFDMVALDYIKMFTNFFIIVSYSVNFTIYCSMSKKFRETFHELVPISERAKRRRARRLLNQQEQTQQQSQYNPPRFMNSQDHSNFNVTVHNEVTNNPENTVLGPGCASLLRNDSVTTTGSVRHNAAASPDVTRYYPCKRSISQQQECEL